MKDVAFVLDTSGSMAGKKLDQAKKALQFCVENLNDGDRFEVMRFSTEVEPLFDKLVDASKSNRAKATDFIKDLKADRRHRDRRRLAQGPRAAARASDRPFVVIFLTDGRPTIGTTDEDQIVANVKKRERRPHAHLLLRHRHGREHAFAGSDHRGHPRLQPIRPARGRHRGEGLQFLLQDQRAGPGESRR